uniref:1-O-acylglucose:anthocyanin-O-acyltransferase-like protein n=1 Tax=Gentiana triflora TaxID=55190 RepID=B0I1H9_GENTR|nr:1-O-acylglucose:anthocyanin-O-acyltransferase- like protein [Gentiana triflora]
MAVPAVPSEGHEEQHKSTSSFGIGSIKFQCSLFAVLLFALLYSSSSQSIVKTLPGFHGSLPFTLESGYVGVGENEELQLFYYFIESERDPANDPLVIWLTGGPGCSAFSGLIFEIGPLTFDFESYQGGVPTLNYNPHSWTKEASIIFVDSPVGTGYSYSNTFEGYHSTDHKASDDLYAFLRKWLLKHPKFLKNPVYVGGDSYGGKFVALVTWRISQGIDAGHEPRINLQGYIVGNPVADGFIDGNAPLPFAHRMGLISDDIHKMAEENCNGNYIKADQSNGLCLEAIKQYEECTADICFDNILEPNCQEKMTSHDISLLKLPSELKEEPWCRKDSYFLTHVWANDPSVQKALHIREGTIKEWVRCNYSISYSEKLDTVLEYHHLLSKRGYKTLAYSGDHDLYIPYTATLEWIHTLNLPVADEWRPWKVDNQVAGYTKRFIHNETGKYVTFATVKAAGHTAPEYKRRECLAMVARFFSDSPL